MRKVSALVLAVFAALAFAASDAGAQALGPHRDGTGGTYETNPCRACHNTAAATAALRGWAMAVAPSGTGWQSKGLSYLCYTCHDAGGGPLVDNAHSMANNAFADTSHSYVIADCPAEPDGAVQGTAFADPAASGLPYMLAPSTEMECTSCHNVHVSTDRPFNQRAGYQAMCVECHQGHEANNAAPANRAYAMTAGNRSNHPTNVLMGTSNTGKANLKTVAEMDAVMRVATPAAPNYALGGHLSAGATGNIDCQTCHAVHGPVQDTPGTTSLLAVDNANLAGATSALCEGCHWGGDIGEQVGTWTTAVVGEYSDHPIDALLNRPFYPTGVVIPDGTHVAADWSDLGTPNDDIGAAAFTTDATPGPRCSSCHDTHGGLADTQLLRGPSVDDTGAVTWAFTYDEWCFVCHLNSEVIPNNHHSNVNNDEAPFTSQLSCGDCHGADGQTDWTAHNGFWRFEVAISTNDSAFCEACHITANPRTFNSPALKTGQSFTNNLFPATHGTPTGVTAAAQHQTDGTLDATNANVMTGLTAAPSWAWSSNGVSEWAATNGPICESCHNILANGMTADQGLTQGWKANILLAPFEDDGSGNLAGGAEAANDFYGNYAYGTGNTGDRFCRTCHNTGGAGYTPGNAGTEFVHNPAAHTMVSATYAYAAGATPYGRSTDTILTGGTCPEATTADTATAPGAASYPDDNVVNCDSCHRPHNADDDSLDASGNRYLILETTNANAWGTTICAECHNTDIQCNN